MNTPESYVDRIIAIVEKVEKPEVVMPKGMKGEHQCRSCNWCDELYCVSCSDAETSSRFCSQECESEHADDDLDGRRTRHADAASRARDMQATGRGL
jgi:hypothetical protein